MKLLICVFPTCVLCALAVMLSGCPGSSGPGLPPEPVTAWRFFPYYRWDQTYSGVISVVNRDETYAMDLTVTYRDAAGATVATETVRLGPKDCHRVWREQFTGSVELRGTGEQNALVACLETRHQGLEGVALTQPATSLYHWGFPWFYRLGVLDEGPGGNTRTTVITANVRNTPLYVRHGPLALLPCTDMFEVLLSPYQLHLYRPYDHFTYEVGEGVREFAVYAGATTGPNRTGQQSTDIAGTIFAETSQDIGMANFVAVNNMFWSMGSLTSTQPYQLYFADVQDDGVNRRDRLFVKSNAANNYPVQNVYNIHFYDESGTENTTPHPPFTLVDMFQRSGSYKIIRPMADFTGQPFKGSVWVESTHPNLAGAVRREAPGLWSDTSLASPAGSLISGCIPYVTSEDANWSYEIVLFFPLAIHPAPDIVAGQPAPPDAYGGSTDPIPVAENGVVVLRFRDMTGFLTGWAAIFVRPNETRYLRVKDIAQNHLNTPIEGSVEFEPHVVCLLQVRHEAGRCHASMGNWLTGQR